MYFASRMQAGRMLAAKLSEKYSEEKCAVMALDDGGVIVGMNIAQELHCVLTLMNTAQISLPMEPAAVAGITTGGALAYNPQYAKGELDEMLSENRGFIEQEKQLQLHNLNSATGLVGTIDKRLLQDHNVVVVSDGLKSAFQVDLAYEYLKPIKMGKLIFAVPFATVAAVDRMHVLGDELICLDVLEGFADTNHYYDKNDMPSHEKILTTLEQLVVNWK